MKKILMTMALPVMLYAANANAQSSMVEVTAPADADVTISEQQKTVPVDTGTYNNSDMKPLPDNPGVEVETVGDAMTPQTETETDIDVQATIPADDGNTGDGTTIDSSVQITQ